MKKAFLFIILSLLYQHCFYRGFFAHQKINYYAVFLLPPEMLILYKPNIEFITEHAVDPDKRRYAVAEEGPGHYIDTAWVDAGQPDLTKLCDKTFSEEDLKEFELLNQSWKSNEMKGRKED
jgi:hypothetical protein